MIGIIDFGSCNISSVKNALDFLEVENRIRTAVEVHEPRVTAVSVEVDFTEDQNELNCSVSYLILGINPKFDDVSVIFKP